MEKTGTGNLEDKGKELAVEREGEADLEEKT